LSYEKTAIPSFDEGGDEWPVGQPWPVAAAVEPHHCRVRPAAERQEQCPGQPRAVAREPHVELAVVEDDA
jgi:hypothetical protein